MMGRGSLSGEQCCLRGMEVLSRTICIIVDEIENVCLAVAVSFTHGTG